MSAPTKHACQHPRTCCDDCLTTFDPEALGRSGRLTARQLVEYGLIPAGDPRLKELPAWAFAGEEEAVALIGGNRATRRALGIRRRPLPKGGPT